MEAVFHESGKVSEVGSVRGEGEGFKAKRDGGFASLQKSNRRVLGAGWASRAHQSQQTGDFQPLIPVMPKIKTSRTKKAPEGFEEIEPVGTAFFTVT